MRRACLRRTERGGKRELCEDFSEHLGCGSPDNRDGLLVHNVADVMIFDVDVLRLGGGHVFGSEGDAILLVLEGGGRAFDEGTSKKYTEEHGFVGRRSKGPMYSASAVERATVCWRLLFQETGPSHFIVMKPVRERRSTASAKKETCQMRRSMEMVPVKSFVPKT
jgi:hypothetical protein